MERKHPGLSDPIPPAETPQLNSNLKQSKSILFHTYILPAVTYRVCGWSSTLAAFWLHQFLSPAFTSSPTIRR